MKNNGFILLEILLSLVILGTVLVASIIALSNLIRATSSSGNVNTVATLSQQLLAEINLNQFVAGRSSGKNDNEIPALSWEVVKTDVSDIESQYETVIKWHEHGL